MAWSGGFPSGLFQADLGNNSGQKLSDRDTTGYFRIEQAGDGSPITTPPDITTDAGGYIYLCDSGNRRVLRFNSGGGYVQRVDVEPDASGLTLLAPVSVAANDSIVYIADRGRGEVIRYQRRK